MASSASCRIAGLKSATVAQRNRAYVFRLRANIERLIRMEADCERMLAALRTERAANEQVMQKHES